MGRETWNLSKNGYDLGASSGSCNAALSTAGGSQLKKAGRPPGNRRCSPQTCQLALCCLRPLGQAQRVEVGWCSVHRLQIWLDSVQKGTGK